MKKLFFSALAVVTFTLMSFTTDSKIENIDTIILNDNIEVEILNDSYDPEVVRCRWRTCTYYGGQKDCTPWTYGYCDKEDGKLTPIRLVDIEE